MIQPKLSQVHVSMLDELSKKWKMKSLDILEEYIQESYNNTFARKKR